MFYQIFLSPQVERYAIITFKHGIWELSHQLQNDLRLKILDPTAFSPMGGGLVPTQEKKKKT